MQTADGGMGVPGAARAVAGEHLRHRVGVIREMLQRHRAILDEGDGLRIPLHRHHDVEAGLAYLPDRFLADRLRHLHHGVHMAVIGHTGIEALEVAHQCVPVVAGEFHQEQTIRRATGDVGQRRPEHRDVGAEHQHVVVDELHRHGIEIDDRLRRLHGGAERGEVADAHDPVRWQARQFQGDAGGGRQRALRADEEMGEVRPRLDQRIEIVAADPALHARVHAQDLVALGFGQGPHGGGELAGPPRAGDARRLVAGETEAEGLAVMEQSFKPEHVVAHLAEAQGAGAAGIVAGHAPDGAAGSGGGFHGKEPAVGLHPRVQPFQHHAGLDGDRSGLRVVGNDPVEMARAIDHEAAPDGLAVLGGAAAPHDHRHIVLGRDLEGRCNVGGAAWQDHPCRHDLVDRGVVGIAPPGEGIELRLAGEGFGEAARQAGALAVGGARTDRPRPGDGRRGAVRAGGGLSRCGHDPSSSWECRRPASKRCRFR